MACTNMKFGTKVYLHKFAILLVIIGGLNWGGVSTGVNVVERLFGQKYEKYIYGAVGLAALYLVFQRDVYLPFLGHSVAPPSAFSKSRPEFADIEVQISVPQGEWSHVVYWAADRKEASASDEIKFASEAYNQFENSAVEPVKAGTDHTLKIQCPQQYYVRKYGFQKVLPKHVHYRFISPRGIVSRVYTKKVVC